MENIFWYALGGIVVVGLIRPLLWWVLLGSSLWVGRKVLSPKWGRRVFGHFWDSKRIEFY